MITEFLPTYSTLLLVVGSEKSTNFRYCVKTWRAKGHQYHHAVAGGSLGCQRRAMNTDPPATEGCVKTQVPRSHSKTERTVGASLRGRPLRSPKDPIIVRALGERR